MKKTTATITTLTLAAFLAGCGDKAPPENTAAAAGTTQGHDGSDDHDHEHDEVPLGTFTIGDMEVEAAQSHGLLEPGKEGHLVIKLPHNDAGATVVRAWIGSEDRTLSTVGLGEYAASHDDYDIHALAPDPLPEDAQWWVEVERPDGTRALGAITPIK